MSIIQQIKNWLTIKKYKIVNDKQNAKYYIQKQNIFGNWFVLPFKFFYYRDSSYKHGYEYTQELYTEYDTFDEAYADLKKYISYSKKPHAQYGYTWQRGIYYPVVIRTDRTEDLGGKTLYPCQFRINQSDIIDIDKYVFFSSDDETIYYVY